MRRRSLFLSIVLLACGAQQNAPERAVELRYHFSPGLTADVFVREGAADPRELPPEQRSVLLVPRGVRASGPSGERPSEGPARYFFVPGAREWRVTLRRSNGIAGFTLPLELGRGRAYELIVSDAQPTPSWAVVELDAARYADLHDADSVQPELPLVRPLPAAALPLGVQPDGSVVLPPSELYGLPALHVSAPLYACPDERGTWARHATMAISASELIELCRGSHPEVLLFSEHPAGPGELERGAAALNACYTERFGERPPPWSRLITNLAWLCADTLGADWKVPRQRRLEAFSDVDLAALLGPFAKARPEANTSFFYRPYWLVADPGLHIVALTPRGEPAPPGGEGEPALRCVREASNPPLDSGYRRYCQRRVLVDGGEPSF